MFAIMHTPPEVSALGMRYLGAYLLARRWSSVSSRSTRRSAPPETRGHLRAAAASVGVTLVLDPLLILGLGADSRARHRRRRGRDHRDPRRRVRARPRDRGSARCAEVRPSAIAAVLAGRANRIADRRHGRRVRLIYVLVTRTATQFGTPALAALGIGHRVESWLYMIGVGFGAATAAIVGQNLGAGRPDRAERAGWLSPGFATLFGLVACVASCSFPSSSRRLQQRSRRDRRGGALLAHRRILAVWMCAEIVLEGALGGAGQRSRRCHVDGDHGGCAFRSRRGRRSLWRSGLWWTISLTAHARG